jgi:hypothetical protein
MGFWGWLVMVAGFLFTSGAVIQPFVAPHDPGIFGGWQPISAFIMHPLFTMGLALQAIKVRDESSWAKGLVFALGALWLGALLFNLHLWGWKVVLGLPLALVVVIAAVLGGRSSYSRTRVTYVKATGRVVDSKVLESWQSSEEGMWLLFLYCPASPALISLANGALQMILNRGQ